MPLLLTCWLTSAFAFPILSVASVVSALVWRRQLIGKSWEIRAVGGRQAAAGGLRCTPAASTGAAATTPGRLVFCRVVYTSARSGALFATKVAVRMAGVRLEKPSQ
jgi:hypothetical protein